MKQYSEEYREANKDKISANMKEYYEANKEKVLAQKKQFYENNKAVIKIKERERYAKNREDNREERNRKERERYAKKKLKKLATIEEAKKEASSAILYSKCPNQPLHLLPKQLKRIWTYSIPFAMTSLKISIQ